MIDFAKSHLAHIIIEKIKEVFKDYTDAEESVNYYKTNFSKLFKFYTKIRKDEVWTKEDGEKRIKELEEYEKNH